jgi:uncharacterized metal-binding protein
MVFLVVFLFIAFILVPLIDITLKANYQLGAKIVLYVIATCWFVYEFFIAHRGIL